MPPFFVPVLFALLWIGACRDAGPSSPELPAVPEGLPQPAAELLGELDAKVRAAPESKESIAHLGLAYEANGLWPQAAKTHAVAASRHQEEPHFAFHRALCLEQLGQFDEAHEIFESLAGRETPPFAPALDRVARRRLEAGDLEAAATGFERLAATAEGRLAGRLGLGRIRFEQGDLESAAELAEGVLTDHPENPRAHYLRGLVQRARGHEEAAKDSLRRGQQGSAQPLSDAWSSELWRYARTSGTALSFAREANATGDVRRAAQLAHQAMTWESQNVEAINLFAALALRLGDPKSACEAVRPTLSLDPVSMHSLFNLAACESALGNDSAALAAADRAVARFPRVGRSHQVRARTLLRSGQTGGAAEAVQSLRRARELRPHDPEILRDLAFAVLGQNRTDEAIELFEELERLDPSSFWGPLGLAEVSLKQGDLAAARQAWARAEPFDPQHPALADLRARIEAATSRAPGP